VSRPVRSLRRRFVASFVAFAAAVSLLFAGSSLLVGYMVEDSLFEQMIAEEGLRQQRHWREQRSLAPSASPFISVHLSAATFPADLRHAVAREGRETEYAGEGGRYYHVAAVRLDPASSAFIVAEVGTRLAVRPMRGGILGAIAFLSLLILALAAALGWWLATRTLAPLGRLAEEVGSAKAGEIPRIEAAAFPTDEIGVLARALEQALERTRAFVERETRFTRDASHELRTPLAVIRSSIDLISEKGDVPEPLRKPLERIAEAARQMEEAIEMLLLLAREERQPGEPVATPLLPIVERVVLAESARFGAERRDVRIDVPARAATRLPESVAAAIIGNLVGNALRHGEGAPVRIATAEADLIVADDGPGLPPEVAAALEDAAFETIRARGTGFGLALVARLCRLHGVKLTASSGGGGSGTEVCVGMVAVTPRGDGNAAAALPFGTGD
jgi:signal transduction histidine kinase